MGDYITYSQWGFMFLCNEYIMHRDKWITNIIIKQIKEWKKIPQILQLP